ncbi:MAG: HAD-IIB family hydrolase [bacterium]
MNPDASKKVIICDLDGTLARSKSALESSMASVISDILITHRFVVISGGAFPQFQKQFLSHLVSSSERLKNLYLFPTNGSTCYVYDVSTSEWKQLYDERLTPEEKKKIYTALDIALAETNIDLGTSYGERIEDRGGQIAFSARGQEAPIEVKEVWDPDQAKRKKIVEVLMREIPEFEIKIGGATTIDITHKGINKAYAMRKIFEYLNVGKEDVVFIGDAIFPGGNDFAVTQTGVECIKVSGPKEAEQILERYTQP